MIKTLASLFTSGIRELESKYKTDADITNSDILWAGVDMFALASSLKLLKASKAVSSTKILNTEKSLSLMQKTSLFSSKLIKNKSIQGLLKYTAISTTAYIAVTHPSMINSLLNELVDIVGINPILFKALAWSIILFLVLQPLLVAFNHFIKPLLWITGKINHERKANAR